MVTIPIKEIYPDLSFETTLGGVILRLRLKWNETGEFWTLDILSRENEPLATGIRLVSDFNLLNDRSVEGLPSGILILFDPLKLGSPNFENLNEYELIYNE